MRKADKEKVMEIFTKAMKNNTDGGDAFNEALRDIKALPEETEDGWVDFRDREPKEGDSIMVLLDNLEVRSGTIDDGDFLTNDMFDGKGEYWRMLIVPNKAKARP